MGGSFRTRLDAFVPVMVTLFLFFGTPFCFLLYTDLVFFFFFFFFFFFARFYFPASGQAVVTGVVPSPRFLPPTFIAHRVQQSHCSSIFHRVLLTHALAFSASQFVRKNKSPPIYTRMQSGGIELTKLTCTRLEDNLIRHRGGRLTCSIYGEVRVQTNASVCCCTYCCTAAAQGSWVGRLG